MKFDFQNKAYRILRKEWPEFKTKNRPQTSTLSLLLNDKQVGHIFYNDTIHSFNVMIYNEEFVKIANKLKKEFSLKIPVLY